MVTLNTNILSLMSQRHLNKSTNALNTSTERLSSGLRINSARDDASGLAIGMQLELSSRLTQVDIRQSNDTISRLQVADGALQGVSDILVRLSELDIQARNGTNTPEQVTHINVEFSALVQSMSEIQNQATLNGQSVFDTSVQSIPPITGTAGNALPEIQTALDAVSTSRTNAGAGMNAQQFMIQSYEVSYENQMAAKSRIMDADMAEEMSNQTRNLILQQAGIAMLAQSNQIPSNILTLLR